MTGKYFGQQFQNFQKSSANAFLRRSSNVNSKSSMTTKRKTVFPRSWNIMESPKKSSRYYRYINFLAKKDCISHHRKFQNKNFSAAQNKNFSVISKYHLFINFFVSHHQKVLKKNFLGISKYHLSIGFLTVFPFLKSSE